MTRTVLIALTLVATGALALSACGEDDVAASGEQAAQEAKSLTEQLRDIERGVREDIQRLDDGTAARARAEEALDDAAKQARQVAQDARKRLPEDNAARREIEQAANRIADAADTPDAADRPEDARAALDRARENLAQAIGSIDQELPESGRKELQELRESLEQG